MEEGEGEELQIGKHKLQTVLVPTDTCSSAARSNLTDCFTCGRGNVKGMKTAEREL